MAKPSIREQLIQSGVNNLKEYGYPKVDDKNILTDRIYSAFFKEMLDGTLGKSAKVDPIITELMTEIDKNQKGK